MSSRVTRRVFFIYFLLFTNYKCNLVPAEPEVSDTAMLVQKGLTVLSFNTVLANLGV